MDDITSDALARYLADECSLEEVQAVESWLDADPVRYRVMEEHRRIWEAAAIDGEEEQEDIDVHEEWEELSRRLDALEADDGLSRKQKERRAPDRPRWRSDERFSSAKRVLLTLTTLVVLAGSVWLGHRSATQPATESSTVAQKIVTESGERTRIHFQDGTRIVLNVESRLSIPQDFESGKREVQLDGEAFFEVASNDRPFIVHTEEGRVQVHGTEFNVRSYDSEGATQVAVREGRVSVHSQEQEGGRNEAVLEAGQLSRLDKEGRLTTEQMSNIESYLAWTEGRLVFDERLLSEVASELERWYGIEVIIEESELRSHRLTASIQKQSLTDVLRIITASLGMEYEIRGSVVILTDAHTDTSD